MPKYSFIVPVYNCGTYLVPCVESLLSQTFQDFEILLIDDGTPDDGGAICEELAEKYACIRVFHKENGGAASARNYGIDRAKGDYLLFIDGDDTIEPDTLMRVEAANAQEDQDLVIFGMSFDYYEKRNVPKRAEHLSVKYPGYYSKIYYLENFEALFDDNALSSSCNKVFSARILRENSLYARTEMTLYEDLEFVLRYFEHVDKFCCMDVPLYHYRIDVDNFGHKRARQLRGMQDNLDLLADTMLSLVPVPADAANLMANLYMQLLTRHLLVTRYTEKTLQPVWDYGCARGLCRALEKGAVLQDQEAFLMKMLDAHDGKRLLCWMNQKRAKIALRRTIKKVLKLLGLRR